MQQPLPLFCGTDWCASAWDKHQTGGLEHQTSERDLIAECQAAHGLPSSKLNNVLKPQCYNPIELQKLMGKKKVGDHRTRAPPGKREGSWRPCSGARRCCQSPAQLLSHCAKLAFSPARLQGHFGCSINIWIQF